MAEQRAQRETTAPARKAPAQKNELKPTFLEQKNLYVIKYSGQGATPKALSGSYTTEFWANHAITHYLKKKK